MAKVVLRFHNKPEIGDLEGLSINGAVFEEGSGTVSTSNISINIPNTFRFTTHVEVAETDEGQHEMIMTQYLTRGLSVWEMGEAFSRIGFRDPEIESQMRSMCSVLVDKKGLAYWAED